MHVSGKEKVRLKSAKVSESERVWREIVYYCNIAKMFLPSETKLLFFFKSKLHDMKLRANRNSIFKKIFKCITSQNIAQNILNYILFMFFKYSFYYT